MALVLNETDENELIKGQTYIVIKNGTTRYNSTKYIGIFSGINNRIVLRNVYLIHGTQKLREGGCLCLYSGLIFQYKFYKVIWQKGKIQSDMEQRSINLILRRIIGDELFIY
jgi:hypothetical protein